MTSNELLDPSLVHGMQILKLMHCWKFLNVQAIWGDNIWKSREKAEVDIFRVREIFKESTNVSLSFMWTGYVFMLLRGREQHCLHKALARGSPLSAASKQLSPVLSTG